MAKKRSGWQQMDKASTPLAQLLHHFEIANQTEGKSDETVTWYNNRLGVFLRWLQERNEGLLHCDRGARIPKKGLSDSSSCPGDVGRVDKETPRFIPDAH